MEGGREGGRKEEKREIRAIRCMGKEEKGTDKGTFLQRKEERDRAR